MRVRGGCDRDVTMKTPDRKESGDVNAVMPGSGGF